MTVGLVEQIKADREAGTPRLGGWFWHGGRDHLSLATQMGGRRYVMGFSRKGMRGAQPTFQINGVMHGALDDLTEYEVGDGVARGQKQAEADRSVYRMDVIGVDHPDARRIARVPDLEDAYLAAIARITDLEAQLAAKDALIREMSGVLEACAGYIDEACERFPFGLAQSVKVRLASAFTRAKEAGYHE